MLRTPLSLPIAAWLLLSATGCATIPNAHQLATGPTGKTPVIQGAIDPKAREDRPLGERATEWGARALEALL